MKHRLGTLIVGTVAIFSLTGATAQAATVTIGSPGPANSIDATFGTVGTAVNSAIPGATVSAPRNGVITSWKTAGATGGPFFLQVVHSLRGGLFKSAGSTGPGAITGSGTLTFQSNLKIAKGDRIGLVPTSDSDHIGAATPPGSTFIVFLPPLGSAGQAPVGSSSGELGFNAQELLNCIIPKLGGKKIGAARKKLARAGCAAPKVKKKGGKFVKKQNPPPGTEIRGDARETLKLGPKT